MKTTYPKVRKKKAVACTMEILKHGPYIKYTSKPGMVVHAHNFNNYTENVELQV